jgi:hypothetical protein
MPYRALHTCAPRPPAGLDCKEMTVVTLVRSHSLTLSLTLTLMLTLDVDCVCFL